MEIYMEYYEDVTPLEALQHKSSSQALPQPTTRAERGL